MNHSSSTRKWGENPPILVKRLSSLTGGKMAECLVNSLLFWWHLLCAPIHLRIPWIGECMTLHWLPLSHWGNLPEDKVSQGIVVAVDLVSQGAWVWVQCLPLGSLWTWTSYSNTLGFIFTGVKWGQYYYLPHKIIVGIACITSSI